jgi:putative tryptophan/tyrosine transport system substrate-binding protein
MRRRDAAFALLALAAAPRVVAQPPRKIHRVGFVATTSPLAELSGSDPANPFARAFVHGLRDLGYVQGKNLVLEMRTLEGKPERLEAVIADFVRLKMEVVFLPSSLLVPPAHKAAPTLPIVGLVNANHLIATGLVQSMGRPGGTITGLSLDVDEDLEAKRVELFIEFVPQPRRIAFVGLREEWERPYALKMRAAAERLGKTMFHVESAQGDFTAAFSRLKQERADAFMVERSPWAYGRRREIGQLAMASGLPSSCGQAELVEQGCLMSYSPDNNDLARRLSGYVDKILRGTKPGDLPIEAPTKFDLVINAKAAKALGIAIPQSILLRTDRVIE